MKYIVVDIETTGLYPEKGDRIIEIAALPIINEMLSIENSYNQLVNPSIKIPEYIRNMTNITDDMVKNQLTIDKVLPCFIEYIGDSPLIAHNAPFDIGFLNYYLKSLNLNIINNRVIDTLTLSREIFYNDKSHNLDSVARRLGVKFDNIQRHRALGDVIITAKVFLKLKDML